MSDAQKSNLPFKTLGVHLRHLREQSGETMAEVSGAVEIEEAALERIELGVERPMEEILLLLISHYGMHDQEAVRLWELAGYEGEVPDRLKPADEQITAKNIVMLLALDMRTLYTDQVEVMTGPSGLTLNFGQQAGHDRAVPVARLGMSYEQAHQVLGSLQQALLKAKYLSGPKTLPPGVAENN